MASDGSDDDWEALDDAGTFEATAQELLEQQRLEEEKRAKFQEKIQQKKDENRMQVEEQKRVESERRRLLQDEANAAADALRLTNDQPTITQPMKILKRDPKASKVQHSKKKNENTAKVKTLKEKEADYAEARARIMGKDDTNKPTHIKKREAGRQNAAVDSAIIREPIGPSSNGSGGFGARRSVVS
eukprot:m.45160 g.45160  ORF g.45160 m.45160 type:complete len:187 (-) comp19888_c1_seq3:384-944(-)